MLIRTLRTMGLTAALLASPLALSSATLAAEAEIYESGSFFGPKFAVGGYDPVAYFEAGKPVEGTDEFATEYKGATWRFASAESRDKFIASPETFAPQYGGYCAWAVSQGYTASGDPKYWRIVDGKLYLNYDASVQETWETDIPGFIAKGDANWPAVLQ